MTMSVAARATRANAGIEAMPMATMAVNAERYSAERGEAHRDHADEHRRPGTDEQPGQDVDAEAVCTEQVTPAGRLQYLRGLYLQGVVGGPHQRHERREDDQRHQHDPDPQPRAR